VSGMAVIVNMFTVATLIFIVALIASGGPALPGDDAEAWWIFVATVLSSPVALLAFYGALALLGSTRTSMIMNSEPILTIGLAVALFGEVMAPIQFAGAALVIGAIFLVSVYDRR
ncbi:MAG: EamA family transporter, partial [Methyloligellaceae bacterium]